jgi:hypothetical protein
MDLCFNFVVSVEDLSFWVFDYVFELLDKGSQLTADI